jgi:hypothetical protein
MRIALALLAACVFIALLIMDTGALLRLAFDWTVSHTVAYYSLIGAACVALSWYVWRRKHRRVGARPQKPARVRRRSKVKRSSKPRGRRQSSAPVQRRR